eukprot:6174664-Pleurochrysis_carterae.AAC.1
MIRPSAEKTVVQAKNLTCSVSGNIEISVSARTPVGIAQLGPSRMAASDGAVHRIQEARV